MAATASREGTKQNVPSQEAVATSQTNEPKTYGGDGPDPKPNVPGVVDAREICDLAVSLARLRILVCIWNEELAEARTVWRNGRYSREV